MSDHLAGSIVRHIEAEVTMAFLARSRAHLTENYDRADAFWLGLTRALEVATVLRDRDARAASRRVAR